MRRTRRLLGVLLIVSALLVLQLPPVEAVAASSAASDFTVVGGTLTRYNGSASNVSVPSSVTKIATDAFKNNTNIVTVSLPNSVTEMEPYAFWGCSSLEAVSLGTGLSEIGDFVFANCKGLRSMVIPANIRSIGIYAFQDDIRLTDITIPYQTSFIHDSAFDGCYRLVIHAPEGSYAYRYAQSFAVRQEEMPEYEDVADYAPVPISADSPEEEPSAGNSEVLIEPVTEIDDEGNPIASVHIVGNRAVFFLNNETPTVYNGIPAVTPGGGESQEAEKVEAEETLRGGGESRKDLYVSTVPKYTIVDGSIVADQAFYRAAAKTSLELPGTITEIGQFAYARSALTSAFLPGSVERIGYGAFYHCDELAYVELPVSVEVVEPKAFEETKWVREFRRGSSNPEASSPSDFLISGGVLVAYRGSASEVEIPNGVRVIAAQALQGHTEITKVALPDTLVSIGEEAFEGCTSLAGVTGGDSLESIRDRAFRNCSLSELYIPSTYRSEGVQIVDADVMVYYAITELPEFTCEATTQRLSNAAFREGYSFFGEEEQVELLALESGVTVLGDVQALARLDGADRAYVLSVAWQEESEALSRAITRAEGIVGTLVARRTMGIYELELTDASGVSITKLGRQTLEVAIPVSEEFSGESLRVLTVDRNGQLEELPCEVVRVGETDYARFETYHLSPFGIYGSGEALGGGELIVSDTVFASAAAPAADGLSGASLVRVWAVSRGWRLYLAGALVLSGVLLLVLRKKA